MKTQRLALIGYVALLVAAPSMAAERPCRDDPAINRLLDQFDAVADEWTELEPNGGQSIAALATKEGIAPMGGHTHTNPDDRTGGRSHIERKWGVNFVNVSALTRCHGHRHSTPMSRLFTFTEGSNEVRVQCYLHTSQNKPEGWYEKAERTIEIGKAFQI